MCQEQKNCLLKKFQWKKCIITIGVKCTLLLSIGQCNGCVNFELYDKNDY